MTKEEGLMAVGVTYVSLKQCLDQIHKLAIANIETDLSGIAEIRAEVVKAKEIADQVAQYFESVEEGFDISLDPTFASFITEQVAAIEEAVAKKTEEQ